MTITAIEAETAHMMLMAERRRLSEWNIDVSGIWRTINGVHDTPEAKEEHSPSYQRRPREAVAALPKNLCHSFVLKIATDFLLRLTEQKASCRTFRKLSRAVPRVPSALSRVNG